MIQQRQRVGMGTGGGARSLGDPYGAPGRSGVGAVTSLLASVRDSIANSRVRNIVSHGRAAFD